MQKITRILLDPAFVDHSIIFNSSSFFINRFGQAMIDVTSITIVFETADMRRDSAASGGWQKPEFFFSKADEACIISAR